MVFRVAALAIVGLLLAPSRALTQERVAADTPGALETVVTLTPARDVRVEWLELTSNEGVRITASRDYPNAERIPLTVPKPSITYLRFFRGAFSPATIPAKVFSGDKAGTLPPPMPGGELFVTLEPATVRPKRFRIIGTSIEIEPENDPTFSIGGLAEGRYTIRPLYEGGRTGTDIAVQIQDGKTTDVFWRKEAVGGASIVGESLRCDLMDGVSIWKEEHLRSVTEKQTFPINPSCRWNLGGLPPGNYLVSAIARNGRGTIMTFEVLEQVVTFVPVPEPLVRLTGRITFDGVPLSDAALSVGSNGERNIELKTDGNGEFVVGLPLPGSYGLFVKSGPVVQAKHLGLGAGENYIDWAIAKEGTLQISTEGFEPNTKVFIRLDSRDQARKFSALKMVSAGELLVMTSIPFGSYSITPSQLGRTFTPIVVTLDALNDTREIKVTPQ